MQGYISTDPVLPNFPNNVDEIFKDKAAFIRNFMAGNMFHTPYVTDS